MSQAPTVAVPGVDHSPITAVRSRKNGHPSLHDGEIAEVFDLIPGLVVVMDRDHTVLDLNQTAALACGRNKQDCVGAKFWDLFDNQDCRAGTCAAARAIRTAATCEGLAYGKAQGKAVPMLATAAPRFGAHGEILGVVEL